MNRAILSGRLTKPPESRTTQSGTTVCTFTLAVDRRFKDKTTGKREADFIPIVAWRETAEHAQKYLNKGSRCSVVGTIQTRSYDAQDGTKRYVTEIVADEVEIIDWPEREGQGAQAAQFTPVDDSEELPF
jgi:single stranded DNA-binding protein (ssb)